MRVLHLIPSISLLRGGPSHAVLAMVSSLRQQGIDASILTTNDNGPSLQSLIPCGSWYEHETQEGLKVPVLAFPRWSPSVRPLREFGYAPELSAWLNQNAKYHDIVHVHSLFSYSTSFGMALFRRQKLPYILRTIGQLNHWSMSQSSLRKRLFLNVLDRKNLHCASALHFTSHAELDEASKYCHSSSSFVLPLGVAPVLSCLSPDYKPPNSSLISTRFLFLSRIHPKKQLPLLLDSLAILKHRHPAKLWQLDLAGDGDIDYLLYISHYCESLGLASQVKWHGFVQGAAKTKLLQQADWFILPSSSENFGIAAAEALIAGTPVVLTPGVAIATDVKEAKAGFVCEPTTEALAACLEQCLEPPSSGMRQRARQLAKQRYSWASISSQLIGHYERILRG